MPGKHKKKREKRERPSIFRRDLVVSMLEGKKGRRGASFTHLRPQQVDGRKERTRKKEGALEEKRQARAQLVFTGARGIHVEKGREKRGRKAVNLSFTVPVKLRRREGGRWVDSTIEVCIIFSYPPP